jgi:hypothetical protein
MNKQELTDKILASRAQLEEELGQISNERMLMVILHGEWSVKDLIGHLGFWESRIATLFPLLKAGNSPEPFKDIDVLNGQAVDEMRTLSLAEVRRLEKAAYQKILAVIKEASDPELFDPDHFAWTEGRRFEEIISDNTWGHYEEHLPELQAWLKRVA